MTGGSRLQSPPPHPTPAPLSHRRHWQSMNAGVTWFGISPQMQSVQTKHSPHPIRRGLCIPHFTGSSGGADGTDQ